jgi:SNF2-related domain
VASDRDALCLALDEPIRNSLRQRMQGREGAEVPVSFSPGSLVRARGRDWIVLPNPQENLLRLRPLTTALAEEIGLFLPLEGSQVTSTEFAAPEPTYPGDATGVMTLFNAARLNLRSGAAPFRSLGQISVTPRPYQFVPLIMALRLDPVRLLIADDVGVGKTIEAGMIARELLDRGIARRLGVVTPAHLCDQWQRELSEKFGINGVLVQPSQMARLERDMSRKDVSVFAHYPNFIGSIDFLKSERHRAAFLRDAPDLIIVDEAHVAARPRGATNAGHQRYELLHDLAADPARHIILVTATPHSGIEESFRSLLGLLSPAFEVDTERKKLLPHVIQRRRRDVEKWLGSETPFPERIPSEERYELGSEYRRLFEDVLEYCRETVETGGTLKQVRGKRDGADEEQKAAFEAVGRLRAQKNGNVCFGSMLSIKSPTTSASATIESKCRVLRINVARQTPILTQCCSVRARKTFIDSIGQ